MTVQHVRRMVQITALLGLFVIPILAAYENLLAKTGSPYLVQSKIEADPMFRFIHALRGGKMRMEPVPIQGDLWWTFRVDGYSISDPLAVAGNVASARALEVARLAQALVPVVIALLLGRIFCGWICPVGFLLEMAEKVRRGLNRLGIVTLDVQFPRWNKYVILVLFILFASIGVWLSEWIYGPQLAASEANTIAVLGVLKKGVPILFAIFLFEVLFSKRFLCRVVCPGGALYSLLSFFRIVRVKHEASSCVGCNQCVPVCTMGLEPNVGKIGHECDGCGTCIGSCPVSSLHYGWSFPRLPAKWLKLAGAATAVAVFFLLLTNTVFAHHVQGVNTNYMENYPQVPAYDRTVEADGYKVTLTYLDVPGAEKAEGYVMGVYIQIKDPTGKPYGGPLRVIISGEGQDTDPADHPSADKLGIYNFRWKYEKKGEYDAEVIIPEGTEGWTPATVANFHISMREQGISTTVLIISGCGVLAVLLIQVVAYVKKRAARPITNS